MRKQTVEEKVQQRTRKRDWREQSSRELERISEGVTGEIRQKKDVDPGVEEHHAESILRRQREMMARRRD